MLPLRHIACTLCHSLAFSKQRLTSSPTLGSVPELQRSTRILHALTREIRASDLCGVVHNEQSPSILGDQGGESVKASSSIPLPDYDHSASSEQGERERGNDVSGPKKSPLTFRSRCELRVARDAAGRVHKRSAFATCVEGIRDSFGQRPPHPPTATAGNSRWVLAQRIGMPAVLGRVPCRSTCGCCARKPATQSPNITGEATWAALSSYGGSPRRSRRELELSNEKLVAAVDGRSCT